MAEPETAVDTGRLATYLESAVGVDATDVTVLSDGLNLVLAVSTGNTTPSFVVRRPTRLRDIYYMNALEGEFGVLEQLQTTDIPAPEPVHRCDDQTVLDGAFYAAR